MFMRSSITIEKKTILQLQTLKYKVKANSLNHLLTAMMKMVGHHKLYEELEEQVKQGRKK